MRLCFFAVFLLTIPAWRQAAAQESAPVAAPAEQATEKNLPEVKGWVYFYRYKSLNAALRTLSVYCDEVELAHLQNGRYFVARVSPGHHAFRSTVKESGVGIDVKAGQKYFLRIEVGTSGAGAFGVAGVVILVPPEQGPYEARKLRPIDASKIVNAQIVVPTEQTAP